MRPYRDFLAGIALIILSAAILHACGGCLRAAPAPAPKPLPAPVRPLTERIVWEDIQGTRLMLWAGGEWDTEFRANGTYRCVSSGGSEYVGSWWVNFSGALEVTEAHVYDGVPQTYSTWSIRWDKDKKNRIKRLTPTGRVVYAGGEDGVEFELKPVKRERPR